MSRCITSTRWRGGQYRGFGPVYSPHTASARGCGAGFGGHRARSRTAQLRFVGAGSPALETAMRAGSGAQLNELCRGGGDA